MTKKVTKPIKNVTYSYECRLNNKKDVKKIALQLNGKVYEFLAFKVKFKPKNGGKTIRPTPTVKPLSKP